MTFENSFADEACFSSCTVLKHQAKFNRFADTEFHPRQIDLRNWNACQRSRIDNDDFAVSRCASATADFPIGPLLTDFVLPLAIAHVRYFAIDSDEENGTVEQMR